MFNIRFHGFSIYIFFKIILTSSVLLAQTNSEDTMEIGPMRTRDLFPMFIATQPYRPVDPSVVKKGKWQFGIDVVRANTFEFSEIFKDKMYNVHDRIDVSKPTIVGHAPEFANLPFVFYFDEEVVRFELRARYGVSENTEIWFELPAQSQYGGGMDSLIENFHKIGFEQFGRDYVKRDQRTLFVIEHGKLTFFNQERTRGKLQDPTIGLTHRMLEHGGLRVSGYFSIKPPLTEMYGVYRSGFDPSIGISARFQPGKRHVFYSGIGYVARTHGSAAYNHIGDSGFRNGWGGHGTWEYRPGGRWRPFAQLYWQSGYLNKHPYQKLDRPSLQHDLGVHWQFLPKAVISFRYINNITHNANTIDVGFGLSLNFKI